MATTTPDISFERDSAPLAEKYDEVSERQYNHGKLLIRDLGIRAGEIAKRRLQGKGKAFVGHAENLSGFPSASFDVVYFNSVFHWLADKLVPLREAARVLKSGGKVGISTASKEKPHQFDLLTRKVLAENGFVRESEQGVTGTKKVTGPELEKLFRAAGLKPIQTVVRTFVDFHPDVDSVFVFSEASSFGNLLQGVDPDRQAAVKAALRAALEKLRGSEGIRLDRHLIFAVAVKP